MKAFLQKYSGLTHSIALGWLFLVGAYSNPLNSGFRDIVNADAVAVYHSLPAGLAKIVGAVFALGVSLWGFYRNGQKGSSATVQVLPGETGAASAAVSVGVDESKLFPRGNVQPCIAAMLISALLVSSIGCGNLTPSQIATEVNADLTAVTNIIAVAEPGATWIPEVQAAEAALKNAITNWQTTGGVVSDIDQALNALVAVLGAVPLGSQVSELVDVVVAGLELALNAIPQPSAATAHIAQAQSLNRHVGRATIKHHMLHTQVGDFKITYNDAVANTLDRHPDLAGKLKTLK